MEITELLIKNSMLAAAKRFTEAVKLDKLEFHFMVNSNQNIFTLGFIDRRLNAKVEIIYDYADLDPSWLRKNSQDMDSVIDLKRVRTIFHNNPVTSDSFITPIKYNHEKRRFETDFEKFNWELWEILPDFIRDMQNTVTRNDIFINSKKSVY